MEMQWKQLLEKVHHQHCKSLKAQNNRIKDRLSLREDEGFLNSSE